MSRATVVAFLVALAGARTAFAQQCVAAAEFVENAAGTIKVTAGSGASGADIGSAINLWKACSGYSQAFPSFSTSTGTIPIVVQRVVTNSNPNGGCGNFQASGGVNSPITSGTITYFTNLNNGAPCSNYTTPA